LIACPWHVIKTNETHSVREYLEEAFGHVGLDLRQHAEIDFWYYRLVEVDFLVGDYSKAKQEQGWEPKTWSVVIAQQRSPCPLGMVRKGAMLEGNASEATFPERRYEASLRNGEDVRQHLFELSRGSSTLNC
jgi:hypothetical protein